MNSFLAKTDLPVGFDMYPNQPDQLTTVKKRTMTQAQRMCSSGETGCGTKQRF